MLNTSSSPSAFKLRTFRGTAASLTGVLDFTMAFESLLLSGMRACRSCLCTLSLLSLSFRLSFSPSLFLSLTLSSEKKLIKAEIDLQSGSGGVRVRNEDCSVPVNWCSSRSYPPQGLWLVVWWWRGCELWQPRHNTAHHGWAKAAFQTGCHSIPSTTAQKRVSDWGLLGWNRQMPRCPHALMNTKPNSHTHRLRRNRSMIS